MLLDAVETGEGVGHNLHLQVVAAAGEVFHFHAGIRQSAMDGCLDLVGLHHRAENRALNWIAWEI
jgi:hypothetical protein